LANEGSVIFILESNEDRLEFRLQAVGRAQKAARLKAELRTISGTSIAGWIALSNGLCLGHNRVSFSVGQRTAQQEGTK
jgi:hypothetical protein